MDAELEQGMDSRPALILHGANSSRSRNQALLTQSGKFADEGFDRECITSSSQTLEEQRLISGAKYGVDDLRNDMMLLLC
jgi:hypothetical protein